MDSILANNKIRSKTSNPPSNYRLLFSKIYKFITKLILYLMIIILSLIFLAFILYLVDKFNNIRNGVKKYPLFNVYVIVSPSMVPTINVNDAVVIKRSEANKLKKGDIITFLSSDERYSGLTITHRIIDINKSKKGFYLYITKGDNNNTKDSAPVLEGNVYGRVLFKIPFIGYVQSILTSSYGWLLFIVLPCLCIVLFDVYKLCRTINSTNKSLIKDKDSTVQKQKKIDLISAEEALELIGETKESNRKDSKDVDSDNLDII